jgi:hypothetical protein
MAAVGWRGFRVPSILAGWFILLSQAMLYGFVYLITSWDLQALISVSLERLMVHMCPAVVLLIGWHWAVVGRRPGAPSANPAVMPASGAMAGAG